MIGASCAASGAASYASERPVQRPVPSMSSFLHDLASGLVPIFMLGLCLISCVFSCAPKILLMVLIIGSSCRLCPSHVLHPIELQNITLANSLVQFGCVSHQTPKSKVNGPRIHFPYMVEKLLVPPLWVALLSVPSRSGSVWSGMIYLRSSSPI